MGCTFEYNGQWYTEAELEDLWDKDISEFLSGMQSYQAKGESVNKSVTAEITLDTLIAQSKFNQKEGLVQSQASPSTIKKVKEFLMRVGVKIEALDTKRYGGSAGIASLLEQVIQLREGEESKVITEEAMHFLEDMVASTDPFLHSQMLNQIGKYKIYQQTKDLYQNEKNYQNADGTPNIIKIKREAIGKLLAEYYIKKHEGVTDKPELLEQVKTWWEKIINFIKGLVSKAGFDPFEQAIEMANTIPTENAQKVREYAELIASMMDDRTYTYKDIQIFLENEEYSLIVREIADQLTTDFQATVDQYLNGNVELGTEILEFAKPYFQLETTPQSSDFISTIEKKLEDKLKDYQLKKTVDNKVEDEDMRNFYTAYIEGKEQRVGRTTDWAKKQNLRNTGGKDYFENATQEEKDLYAKLAMSGTRGHYDIERIIQSALNSDGTLKTKEDISLNFTPATSQGVFKILQEFLLGTDTKQGFLSQFEAGSVFKVEQQIFNEKAYSYDNNGKKLQGRAGTIDLLVLQPTKGAVIYDWKFMKMSSFNPQYQPLKQTQHKLQLADYKKTLKEAYGIAEKDIKAFTIPIAAEYQMVQHKDTKEQNPVLLGITIGNVNIKAEDRPHLLPVAPEGQSTGNPNIDRLLASLNAKYKRIYKKRVASEEWSNKIGELNELSVAIRNLQIAINFEPLSVEAKNFDESTEQVIEKYKSYNAKGVTNEDLQPVLKELVQAINAAKYYSDLDEVFISEYGRDNLTEKNKKVLNSLQQSASLARDNETKLRHILEEIITVKATEEGVYNLLSAEKEAKSITNTMIESGFLPVKSMQFLTKTIIDARSRDEVAVKNIMDEFGDIYEELAKLAKSKGVNPLELIADLQEHALFKKIKSDVYTNIKNAKRAKNKKALLENIDQVKLKALLKERIEKEQADIENRTYSQDSRADSFKKLAKKQEVEKNYNIYKDDFVGWNNRTFSYIVNQSIKEEENYSDEYKRLLNNAEYKPALDMYNFISILNERARKAGYLERQQGQRFLAFVNATLTQRVANSENKLSTAKESLKDMFTVQEYEEQAFGKKDEETGEIDRSIPTLFTRHLEVEKRSQDLLGIVPNYIKALIHFETSQQLEDLFQSTLLIEKNKGHLETVNSKVVFQGDTPKVFVGNNVNTEIVQNYVDDQIYGINLQTEDLISAATAKFGSKEGQEQRALSAKKTLQTTNKWVQQLAVGLKALVAIPNYVGAGMQAVINAGTYYKGREYIINHAKIIGSKFGATSDIQKGLIDMIVPLNDENFKHQLRGIAFKQSTRKWLSTISFQDFMMSTNALPDMMHQLTNALTWLENTMLDENGNMVNITKYVKNLPEYANKYNEPDKIKQMEQEMEKKIKELKDTKSLPKIAKFNEQDILEIPGLNKASIPSYRAKVVEYGRNITSQMSRENKAAYRRNIIANSFMMFKNWIVKQSQLRALDIHKNAVLDEWEYGRVRLFFKTWAHLGFTKISRMRDIIKATPEGIQIMREILDQKREEYYRKTGQTLEITDEEFFDMMRKELRSEAKELAMLFSIMGIVFMAQAAAPPEDEEDAGVKNKYKFMARAINKISDEIAFYYNPLSAESITRGTILPSLGILSKAQRAIKEAVKEVVGGDEDDEAKPLKALFNMVPVAAQFQSEILPITNPEFAKEMGIKTSAEARVFR